jgi:hypothetical protein
MRWSSRPNRTAEWEKAIFCDSRCIQTIPQPGRTRSLSSYGHSGPEKSNARPPEQTLAVLLPAPLACCRFELGQRRMTPPSNFALRIVVEEDSTLVRTLNARYAGATSDGGLDGPDRDALLDVLGKHFTERPWPRTGDMGATRQFMAELQRAMIKARWSVDFFAVA